MTDETTRKFCDLTVTRAAELMHEQGASVPMILDRMLTYSAAQASVMDADGAARMFRHVADQIEAGKFANLGATPQARH
jgi:hypothetical protein